MPCYDGGTEPEYIQKLRSDPGDHFAVLDRSYLFVEGESAVEACDAISRDGALIHLKRKGKASPFSHLCFQASSSCALLRWSSSAQDQLLNFVRSSGASSIAIGEIEQSIERIARGDAEVVFGLLGKWGTRTLRHLPLLSKISLTQSVRRINELGFRPRGQLIDRC